MKKPLPFLGGLLAVLAAASTISFMAQDKPTGDQLTVEVPAAVKATILKEAGKGKIIEFVRANEDSRLLYDATVRVDEREYAIRTDNDGSLIRVEYKGQAEEERELRVEDLPEVIRESMKKHARGGAVEQIHKQQPVFTFVATLDARKFHFTTDAAGRLIKKERVNE